MKDLITSLTEMGIIASPDAIYLLSEQERPLEIVHEILAGRGELLFLDKKDITQTLELMSSQVLPGTGSMRPGHTEGWEKTVVGPSSEQESTTEGTTEGSRESAVSRNTPKTAFRVREKGTQESRELTERVPPPHRPTGTTEPVIRDHRWPSIKGTKLPPAPHIPTDRDPTDQGNGKAGDHRDLQERTGDPSYPGTPGMDLSDHVGMSDGETISLTKPFIPLRAVDRYRPVAAEYQENIAILGDITGKSLCEGKISDFSRYFLDRLSRLRELLKSRPEMMHALPISRMRSRSGEGATIGIVTDIRNGDKGISFTIEDEDSSLNVFIPRNGNARFLKEMGTIMNDEVIGVIGSVRMSHKGHGPSIIPEKIVRPPIPYRHTPSPALEEVSVAFVSDLHMGSKTFLGTEWKRAMAFLAGKNHETREVASRIKYLVFTGDIVDGIGVYPSHEDDLDITDIFLQYHAIADDLNSLPDHIKVIILPGNHDGVRKAEPQPSLPGDIQNLFDPGRVMFTGNPSTLALHGVNILAYHGGGMDDIIPAVPGLTYENPIGAMKEMMTRRHLAPIYGGKTPLAPEHRDYLLMESIPDVFVTGHVHTTQVDIFHNVLLINASCWMSQTAYQKMRDFVPDPAKLPVVRLDTLKPTLVNFAE